MRHDSWPQVRDREYAIRIFVCGYENRAPFVSGEHSADGGAVLILDYFCNGLLNYDANKDIFLKRFQNAVFIRIDSNLFSSVQARVESYCREVGKDDINILFDVSSCSRSVMASTLLAISSIKFCNLEVTCAYALSAFSSPPSGELPSHISEPVVGDLSGWSDDLLKPPCAVIGMGFEPGRALGCIDYLEIPEVRLFMPVGVDDRFEDAVRSANSVLIDQVGSGNVLPYSVTDPADTYQKLESLVHGLLPAHRPVLIPLGPKILAALSIVLAIELYPAVCVWRTSSGSGVDVSDRAASGEIAVFTTTMGNGPISQNAVSGNSATTL